MASSRRLRPAGVAIVALIIAAGASSGCGNNRPSCDFVPESANLFIETGERLNPDESGRSLPTVVRLYQLSSIAALETASFEQIWRSPAETLGEALLGQEELVLYPSARQRRTFERNPDANYLVGVAVFRRPTGTSWRSVLALPLPGAAQQCLAKQEGEEPEPAAPPIVRFRLEDFAIRGELIEAEPGQSPCEAAGASCGTDGSTEEAGAAADTAEAASAPEPTASGPGASGAP